MYKYILASLGGTLIGALLMRSYDKRYLYSVCEFEYVDEVNPRDELEERMAIAAEQECPQDDEDLEQYPVMNVEEYNEIADEYSSTGIYLIEEVEFAAGQMGYNCDALTFYAKDYTWADGNDQIIPDIERYVGTCVSRLVDLRKAGALYVRNEKYGLDLELIWNEGSYNEIVLGIED